VGTFFILLPVLGFIPLLYPSLGKGQYSWFYTSLLFNSLSSVFLTFFTVNSFFILLYSALFTCNYIHIILNVSLKLLNSFFRVVFLLLVFHCSALKSSTCFSSSCCFKIRLSHSNYSFFNYLDTKLWLDCNCLYLNSS
jgi:hypothetical protein